MLKDKTAYEMNRQRYIKAGKELAEQKQRFNHVKKPTSKDKFH